MRNGTCKNSDIFSLQTFQKGNNYIEIKKKKRKKRFKLMRWEWRGEKFEGLQ
jgi:hypothetical protein